MTKISIEYDRDGEPIPSCRFQIALLCCAVEATAVLFALIGQLDEAIKNLFSLSSIRLRFLFPLPMRQRSAS